VPTIGGMPAGFRYARDWNCECIQIYLTLSRQWKVAELSDSDVSNFKIAWKESPVGSVVAHVPFLVNLGSNENRLWEKSIERLIAEINRCKILSVPYLVLHPGSYGSSTKENGLKRVIRALNIVFEKENNCSTRLLLETSAGQGTALCSKFEDIALLLASINRPELVGVCFDTAHIFASGYDVREQQGYVSVMEKFDKTIGLRKIGVIHLNDSKSRLGSRIDRHACIGEGEIGLRFFRCLMRDPAFETVPKILEIPQRDVRSKDNLELLRRLRSND
jgi:deoxyribonuclease IV